MDLGRGFTLVQSNGFQVRFKVGHDEQGRPRFIDADILDHDTLEPIEDGNILESEIGGDHFEVTVEWDGGGSGRYSGQRLPDGTLSGVTVDLEAPDSEASWFVPDRVFAP